MRAKKSLRSHGVGFADDDIDLPSRLPAVLDVLTLVFNEGYLAHSGADLTRADLADESYRLTTLLTTISPDQGGPWALRALQSFHLSRSRTRTGNLLTLDEQDRQRWDHALIDDGVASLDRARRLCRLPTSLLLQAELAACHATAQTFQDTDWQRIVELYDQLMCLDASPVVELNRAIAVAVRDGPAAALPTLNRLAVQPALARSHRIWAARAELHRRLHDNARADQDYQRALELVENDTERAYLIRARQQLSK